MEEVLFFPHTATAMSLTFSNASVRSWNVHLTPQPEMFHDVQHIIKSLKVVFKTLFILSIFSNSFF